MHESQWEGRAGGIVTPEGAMRSPFRAAARRSGLRGMLLVDEGDRSVKQHVNLVSFSFKHGSAPAAALVFDCRRMRNPHFIERLKPLDGRHEEVREYVKTDPQFKPIIDGVVHAVLLSRDGER